MSPVADGSSSVSACSRATWLNEKGLGASLLYLADADFGQEPSPPIASLAP